jgi:cytochrome c oxidase cbb3-type subunit 3
MSSSSWGSRAGLLAALAALAAAGCRERVYETAAGGAPPAILNAVGPIPGPQASRPSVQNPYRGDAMAMQEGRNLFARYNCLGCHGDHAGGGMGPSLRDPAWLYGSGGGDVFGSIAEGRGRGMPSWGTKIPERQIWQLVAYIQSLRTPDEPSPPDELTPPPPNM